MHFRGSESGKIRFPSLGKFPSHAVKVMKTRIAFLPLMLLPLFAQEDPNHMPERHWPHAWQLPPPLGLEERRPNHDNADIMVWVPEGAERIRAILVVPNNTDSKDWSEHPAVREVLAKHETAILYMRRYNTGIEAMDYREPDRERMPALFKDTAERMGIPEFEHAPWITFGKSSRGKFPFRMAWIWPERTIATIVYHGETPSWPLPEWAEPAKEHSILHVNANGETEWAGTWFLHVRPALLNYHANTRWQGHIMVAKDVGHGDYGNRDGRAPPHKLPRERTWDYLADFVESALTLRLPKEGYPTEGPLTLVDLPDDQGVAVDKYAVETLFGIPRQPLYEDEEGRFSGQRGDGPGVSGYVAIPPAEDLEVPEGTPVVPLEPNQSPREWILTDSLKFAMVTDPMVEPEAFLDLRPALGDQVEIDGETLEFRALPDNWRGPNGGIRLDRGLKPQNRNITLLAYTVIEVEEAQHVIVNAGYTAATRIQWILNGVPLRHQQVLSLEPGRYPLLFVLRMAANWDRVEPNFGSLDAAKIEVAREMQAEAEARAAAEEAEKDRPLFFQASGLEPERRQRHMRIPTRELAEHWHGIHAIHGQELQIEE